MYQVIPAFTPTDNRVLVRKIEVTAQGAVLLPPSTKMMFERGEVVSKGPGRVCEATGQRIPIACEVGDIVVYSGGSAADIRQEKETLWLMTESAILGIENGTK